MNKLGALAIAISIPASFALGAWAQDYRVHDAYVREGRVQSSYETISSGYMIYLQCLSDHCERERYASEMVHDIGKQQLNEAGVQYNEQ